MCVIAVAYAVPLSDDLMHEAHKANPDGMGFAWLQDGRVHWSKGWRDIEPALAFVSTLPLPYVAHFRLRSVGSKSDAITHPFPFGGSLRLQGKTDRGVLFHNGHWGPWDDVMLQLLPSVKGQLPGGEWTDSRAMAWLVGRWGTSVLQFMGSSQKIALLRPRHDVELFGNGWVHRTGYALSNDYFERSYKKAVLVEYPRTYATAPYDARRFESYRSHHSMTDAEFTQFQKDWNET